MIFSIGIITRNDQIRKIMAKGRENFKMSVMDFFSKDHNKLPYYIALSAFNLAGELSVQHFVRVKYQSVT